MRIVGFFEIISSEKRGTLYFPSAVSDFVIRNKNKSVPFFRSPFFVPFFPLGNKRFFVELIFSVNGLLSDAVCRKIEGIGSICVNVL